MKRLLFLAIICPLTINAQNTFIKVSPAFITTNEGTKVTAGFLSGGLMLSNKTALGITSGYFKPNVIEKAAIPVGLEFTYCDFTVKKPKPTISMNAMYPIYNYRFSYTDLNSNNIDAGKITGQLMAGINAGLALAVTEKQKVMFTAGYSYLILNTKYKRPLSIKDQIGSTGMFIFTIAGFL